MYPLLPLKTSNSKYNNISYILNLACVLIHMIFTSGCLFDFIDISTCAVLVSLLTDFIFLFMIKKQENLKNRNCDMALFKSNEKFHLIFDI